MDRERMKELTEAQVLERAAANVIVQSAQGDEIQINDRAYRLVKNYRDAYDSQKMATRFSTFLEKYDYLVGDIAANQLRLRGFYAAGTEGVPRSQQINTLQDYLFEEINFGAPYFVLQNLEPHLVEELEEVSRPREHSKKTHNRPKKSKSANLQAKTAAVAEKKHPVNPKPKHDKNHKQRVETKGSNGHRRFQVRERKTGEIKQHE